MAFHKLQSYWVQDYCCYLLSILLNGSQVRVFFEKNIQNKHLCDQQKKYVAFRNQIFLLII